MVTNVKVDGFEKTEQNNNLLRHIIDVIYPLTPRKEEIKVGEEFSIIPFSKKTKEEIVSDITKLMQEYSKEPF